MGIALVTVTTLCFATLEASAKWLIQSVPVLEVVWLRFLFHSFLTSALLAPVYGRDARGDDGPELLGAAIPAARRNRRDPVFGAPADRRVERLAAAESRAATQLMSALGATIVLAPFVLAQWQTPPSTQAWTLLMACGLFGGFGHFCVAQAHRYASAATLGPFLYQQILYMTLWGWLLFGQLPAALVMVGAAVVVTSGLALLWMDIKRPA